jgi:hypothetical protein
LVAAALLVTGRSARATPDFPQVVVRTLALPGITIDPPQGCTLCHTTDAGGTALRPFGALVLQDGAQPYEEATLEQALGQIQHDDPQLVADIQAGKDPNDDTGSAARPTPTYGCAFGGPLRGGAAPWAGAIVLLTVLRLFRTARAGRRRLRPGAGRVTG